VHHSPNMNEVYADETTRERFIELFAIASLYRSGVRSTTFKVTSALGKAIHLTSEGQKLIVPLRKAYPEVPANVHRFSIFLLFGYNRLLIDLRATNLEVLREGLARAISTRDIRYPWVFGHELYDRAFAFKEIRDTLTAEQTNELLDITPGVFQMSYYVVGPLGLLRSQQRRNLRPTLLLPLWHCTSPSCPGLHQARLAQQHADTARSQMKAEQALEKKEGVHTNWGTFFGELIEGRKGAYYDDFIPVEFPWFMGNVFSERELRLVAARLIADTTGLRAELSKQVSERQLLRGSASEIAKRLSNSQLIQLILVAKDEDIIAAIDRCIDIGEILIPITEVRKSPTSFYLRTWADSHFECSRLGTRVIGRDVRADPSARLKRLIRSIYSSEVDTKQLNWRLRHISGTTLGEKLEQLIADGLPGDIVSQLVLGSEEKLREALVHLRAIHLFAENIDEKLLLQKILWKIGFNPSRFESPVERFVTAAQELRSASAAPERGPDWSEKVRSAGVNLFVYLEDVLDRALCFSTWLLLADHFASGHCYDPEEGRKIAAFELSGICTGKDGPINFDPSGKNTLSVLVAGFEALRIKCEEVLNEPHSKYERSVQSTPHFGTPFTLQLFPYKHRLFVLDQPLGERKVFLECVQRVHDTLMQSVVMNVRNRIDHSGGDFPRPDEIAKCCDTLETFVSNLETSGLMPSVYALAQMKVDSSNRIKVFSTDHRGHEITWIRSPVLFALTALPAPANPQIIVAKLHVPDTAEPLRFNLKESSDFQFMWSGYPRRKPFESHPPVLGPTA
jgi:hypothetical protein